MGICCGSSLGYSMMEERAKRKSGTGLAPTSTCIPDIYPVSGDTGDTEVGKQTHSKRYIPDMREGDYALSGNSSVVDRG